jgi:hypothetical protein
MNDTNDKAALREQCGVCGGPIEEGEGREISEGGETIAIVHTDCCG